MNLVSEKEIEREQGCSEKREGKKQIIWQQRIELKGDRRREWLRKEIIKQHRRGAKETK